MRKDVKLGLAVGGVLLAVLVVYVLVVPGNNNQVGATLETLDGSESVGDAANGGAESSGGATASRGETTGDDPAATPDRQARTNGGASADAGATRRRGEGANRGASTNDHATGETAGGGWNWDALVNGTEKLPSLGAGTDVPTNDPSLAFADGGGSVGYGASGTGASGTGASLGNTSTATGTGTSTGATGARTTGAGTTANGNATASDAATLADAAAAGSSQSPAWQSTTGAQPTSTAPEPLTASTRTHVVKVGDTYSSISAAAYGSSEYYTHIEHANPGIDPTRLKPGMTIALPAIDTKPAAAPGAVAQQQQTLDPRSQYKVQPNDSLYTISLRLYGKADRVDKIYELNKPTIGDDMARVKVGMVLKLPEPPTQATAAVTAR